VEELRLFSTQELTALMNRYNELLGDNTISCSHEYKEGEY
jgi:hypothetical protein